MKTFLKMATAAALAASTLAVPQYAAAQDSRNYGSGDVCRHDRNQAANRGTVIGAVAGGIIGSQAAGRGNRTEGTILGAVVGGAAGNAIGRNSVRCTSYPRRISYHRDNCRWVQEYYGNRWHDFEVCQGRDGVWRPSGRG
ncbi:MAG: glycine zipper 2TM domain-containing protein [Caulobacteraceae bacterium]